MFPFRSSGKAQFTGARSAAWLSPGWRDNLAFDAIYTLRTLVRHPAATLPACLCLTLGVGINILTFSSIYREVFADLPIRDAGGLLTFRWSGTRPLVQVSVENSYIDSSGAGDSIGGTFPARFLDALEMAMPSSLAAVAAVAPADAVNIATRESADSVRAHFVSGSFFDVIGMVAAVGRLLRPADNDPSAPPAAVISYEYWTRSFGSDSGIIGRTLTVNSRTFTIVGIAPRSLSNILDHGQPSPPEILLPLGLEPAVRQEASLLGSPNAWWLSIVARISPDSSLSAARDELTILLNELLRDSRSLNTSVARLRVDVVPASQGLSDLPSSMLRRMRLLAVGALSLLLIVCVNLCTVQMSRVISREQDLLIQISIGARASRLIRQILLETTFLAVAATAVAAVGAAWVDDLLPFGIGSFQAARHVGNNWLAVLGVGLLSTVLAVACGAVAALRLTGRLVRPGSLAAVGGRLATAAVPANRALIVIQIGLTLPLLVGAELLLRTVTNLRSVELGFDPQNLILFKVQPELNGYDRQRAAQFYSDMRDRFQLLPGVASVATSGFGSSLMDGGTVELFLESGFTASVFSVDEGFFGTIGIPLKSGRLFATNDRGRQVPVAVVSESFAAKAFGTQQPLGQRIRAGAQVEVIGVVADARVNDLRRPGPPAIYRLVNDRLLNRRVIVRTASSPERIVAEIRSAVHDLDPNLPIQDVTTQLQRLESTYLGQEAILATASLFLASVALAVSVIGLFGITSFSVGRRTRELGIRIALGASPLAIRGLILRELLITASLGVLLGLVVTVLTVRALDAVLFEVRAWDPVSMVWAVVMIVVSCIAAGYFPASQAARVDPLVAVRAE
jgi:predicted permease